MTQIHSFKADVAFDPETLKAMALAFEEACATLKVPVAAGPMREMLAKRVIALTCNGETDPEVIRDRLVVSLRQQLLAS